MIRIVHLSDIHLNQIKLADAEDFVIKALIKDLTSYNQEKEIDLIIFSGDLIDKGGASFNDMDIAFLTFEEKIVDSFSSALGLPKHRFFFAPGNHDVDRKADEQIEEMGLQQYLISTEKVTEYIDSKKDNGVKRIFPFKQFEDLFYKTYQEKHCLTKYQSCFKVRLADTTVGIACFNSAWRCYDRPTDKGNIILGERQVINARQIMQDCDIKIAVMHHPLDWLKEFDRKSVQHFISRDYDLVFCGHVHEGSNWTKSDMYGSQFFSIAPTNWAYNLRDDSRIHANGYWIVDYDLKNMTLTTHSRRYSYQKECYDPNTDLGDDRGLSVYGLPDSGQLTQYHEEINVATRIQDVHFDTVNEHLLSYNTDTKAPKDLNSIFVLPRIVTKVQFDAEKEVEEQVFDIDKICNTDDNILIFGVKESGKTILLNKLLMELTNTIQKCRKIPVYFDFLEVGNRRYETIISQFLGVGIRKIEQFLADHTVLLLIDNITLSRSYETQLRRLEKFLDKYHKVRVVATSMQLLEGRIPLELAEYPTLSSFQMLTIKSFKTKEIRALIRNWFSKSETFDTSQKLDKLLDFFLTLNLPRTPLAISMLLWIIEQQENYKPINHATMLENFIDRQFVKTIKEAYIADMALLKVVAYYYFRSKTKSSDKLYENLIGDLIVYSKRMKKVQKGKIISDYRGKKKKGKGREIGGIVD